MQQTASKKFLLVFLPTQNKIKITFAKEIVQQRKTKIAQQRIMESNQPLNKLLGKKGLLVLAEML